MTKPEDAKQYDPYFEGQTVCQEIRIFLSEEETIAAKLVMKSPREWASNEIHSRMSNIVTNVVNQYVSLALENGWDVPSSKLGILYKALEHLEEF